MNQQSPKLVFERVVSLLKGGERQEAEALCRDMLERDPGDINFVSLLGTILATRGAHEEAVDLLSRAVKAAPGHAKAREDLGTLLLNLDRAEDALPHLERAQELRPPQCGAHEQAERGLSETRTRRRRRSVPARSRIPLAHTGQAG